MRYLRAVRALRTYPHAEAIEEEPLLEVHSANTLISHRETHI